MKSHEVLKESMENVGVKAIASDMNLSSSLLYKWCQPNDEEDENGTNNPLDRVAKIFEATGDENLVAWICQQADGFFSPNPKVGENTAENLFANTHRLVAEFSDLLREVSQSYDKDGEICQEDARRIRREWEELKGAGESFVMACEQGCFKIKKQIESKI
ncbi:MAG: hypothetical protein HOH25_14990 [Opitutae bacterium]|jgi:hypothetical protein|nr:hypothetical protein [Opitutae bacterium]